MVLWLSFFKRVSWPCKIFFNQRCGIVNVKQKWVKDSMLDKVVQGGRDLKATCILISIIAPQPNHCVPIYHLNPHMRQLCLPADLKVSSFIRRFPNMFREFYVSDSGGTPVPWFQVTAEALEIHYEELMIREKIDHDLCERLQKLLMLVDGQMLPFATIDQFRWDIGLRYDYHDSLVKRHPELFSLVKYSDDRMGLKLLDWNDRLAVSHLEKNTLPIKGTLSFPIEFTRGFGLKKKCMAWLEEWQKLPYTSPYVDASHLDPRTDASEKRIVGVFHELLHLTIQKKTERVNFSNLRKPLRLPQKFTKVFERHPGIFYISRKGDTQTVVLREGYNKDQLNEKHPLVEIREKYAIMMKQGFLDRSRGIYKRSVETKQIVSLDSCGDTRLEN